jgi:YD repeat-containing protein
MPTKPVNTRGNFFEATLFLIQRIEYDASGNAIYVDYAAPGSNEDDAACLIVKYSYDGSNRLTATAFADGSRSFDKQWTHRESGDPVTGEGAYSYQ